MQLEWPGHFIGGKFIVSKGSGAELFSKNPSQREEILLRYRISKREIELALAEAADFCPPPFEERVRYLEALKEGVFAKKNDIINLLSKEGGRPRHEAEQEFEQALGFVQTLILTKDKLLADLKIPAEFGHKGRVELLPVGIAASYLSFSAPLLTFLTRVSMAFLSGSYHIIMTSQQSSALGTLLAMISEKASIFSSVMSILCGDFLHFKQLISDLSIDAVIYTGSHENCVEIQRDYKGRYNRALILQAGGKNSLIAEKGADIEGAVKGALRGFTYAAGQLCSSTSRAFVHRSDLADFKNLLKKGVEALRIGPTDGGAEVDLGPLYSAKSVERFLRFQTMANREAEEVLVWGKAATLEDHLGGHFVIPGMRIMKAFDSQSAYQSNVLFSPDLAIYPYEDLGEAIRWANDAPAVVSVSYYGKPENLQARREALISPHLLLNAPTIEDKALFPLAGRGTFGRHRYQSFALLCYLTFPQVLFE